MADGGKEWTVKHVLLPALRTDFVPPRARNADGTVVQITRLEELYKIFERC